MKDIITRIFATIGCLLWLWVGISYGEVFFKNLRPDPQYWQYNAIGLFIEFANNANIAE
jgi:hypothetical protein